MGRLSYPSQLDSPSKQLVKDLAWDLEQLQIHNTELKKVKAYECRSFNENLDRIEGEVEAQHNAALDQVAVLHEQVLEEAVKTLRDHQREEEEKRREHLRQVERARQIRHEEEVRKREEEAARQARIAAERQAAEDARRAEQEAEDRRQAEQAEKERQERERVEEEKRQREAAAQEATRREQEAARRQQEAAQREQEAARRAEEGQQRLANGHRPTAQETEVQNRYIALHRKLKELRLNLRNEGKNHPALKQAMGDIRRSIKKSVGQIRKDEKNTSQLAEIRETLKKAATAREPTVHIRDYLVSPSEELTTDDPENQIPALVVYGMNIFAKCLISSLITEASLNHDHAEPVGVMAAQIFSLPTFHYKGRDLGDILWAKYRVVCPPLWGFYGPERTDAGRRALGWWRESGDGPFISEQGHTDRMTALGAGFSALTLRNFGKSARANPFPNHMFWFAMHKILMVPVTEVTETHVILLTAMLKSSAERIIGFFGHFGMALMRMAIVDLPSSMPNESMGVNQLRLLRDMYRREKNIII